MKIIFLLEEESMKALLDILLPKILPNGIEFITIPHNGKSALRRSIPRKLMGWNEPGDIRFVIVHDQDSRDCIALKGELLELCRPCKKNVLIRIVCQELESWYFGDLIAVEQAYGDTYKSEAIKGFSSKAKYRIPDMIVNPKEEMARIIPLYQEVSGARKIAPYMNISTNNSASFLAFVNGVRNFVSV